MVISELEATALINKLNAMQDALEEKGALPYRYDFWFVLNEQENRVYLYVRRQYLYILYVFNRVRVLDFLQDWAAIQHFLEPLLMLGAPGADIAYCKAFYYSG